MNLRYVDEDTVIVGVEIFPRCRYGIRNPSGKAVPPRNVHLHGRITGGERPLFFGIFFRESIDQAGQAPCVLLISDDSSSSAIYKCSDSISSFSVIVRPPLFMISIL